MKSVYKAICLRKHVMENIRAPKIFRKKTYFRAIQLLVIEQPMFILLQFLYGCYW